MDCPSCGEGLQCVLCGADIPDMEDWAREVRRAWEGHWKGRDHRYGRDFAAFLGERLLTDFDLREIERS